MLLSMEDRAFLLAHLLRQNVSLRYHLSERITQWLAHWLKAAGDPRQCFAYQFVYNRSAYLVSLVLPTSVGL